MEKDTNLFILFMNLFKNAEKKKVYVTITKTKNLQDLRNWIIGQTSFLPENSNWKERCEYILQGKDSLKTCGCGCGTPIIIFNQYAKGHSHRDPKIKEVWKEKQQKTMKERYGEEYGKYLKEKAKETNLEKYGVEHTFQREDVKNSIKQSMIEKFGVDNCSKSDEIKEKKKETYRQNYGTEFNSSPLINDRIRKSRHKNTFKRFQRFSDEVIPLFSLSEFNGGGYDKEYDWECKKCNNPFSHYYHNGTIPRCPICYPISVSVGHQEILDFIHSIYDGEIITNNRSIIYPKEIDIYLPELSLGIEFHGLYWHSEEQGKPKNYHKEKTILSNEKGIKLIQIFEDEWKNKKEIVKSKLSNLIDKENQNRIFARKGFIKEISYSEKKEFLEKNHIQGDDRSSIYLGLFYQNSLVSLMTFGKSRFSKKYEYELIRYCTILGNNVIGAAGKLLNYFIKNYNPNSIVSYADIRWTPLHDDNLYIKIGFSYSHSSDSNYFYFKGDNRESRIRYQKHKLEKILSEYDSNLSESENMKKAGFMKIWDCGNHVFYKIIK